MADEEQVFCEALSEREKQILGLIADGLTNRQIAEELYLTLDTVKWHNRQTYQKLGVHNRTQAVARAREWGQLGGPSPEVRHTLPVQGTVFVGRSQELSDIETGLADPSCRLLTLSGPGGIGKTRLAIEAARRQMGAYPDGVYFVPFASMESTEFVIQALADGLGLVQTDQRNAWEQVISYLREKVLLLVIDNFEHLVEGADLLGEVLARSKAVKLLVTSRERLHLKEEWVFDVQGLRYPTDEDNEHCGIAPADYEAGQLFLLTARRAKAEFAPDEADLVHIARICRLVSGLPLGIELAASWVRLLPCAEIAREIAHSLDILTASWRNVPERHRSMQAVLTHSWELLAAGEQDLFRKLTVFRGSFGLDAATAVADASLTMSLALVDKSFLQRADGDRFAIHELVKQYGSAKLQADPETWASTRLRHCRYHAVFLYQRMSAPDAHPFLDEIESVLDDIQAAWRYAVDNRCLAEIQQLAAGLFVYYRLHSWYRAGSGALALYQQALECFDPDTATPDQRATIACLYESLGRLYELAGASHEMLAAFEQALANTPDIDYIRRGRLYGKIADVQMALHQNEQAHELYALAESVLEDAPQRNAAWWVEWFRIKTKRMELYYWQDRPDDIAVLASQIRPLLEQHGSVTQRLRYLNELAMMLLQRDRYYCSDDAITYTGEVLALSLKTGNMGEVASGHFHHGFSHLWSDHLDEAETHLQIARQMTERSGDLILLSRALAYLAVAYRKRDDLKSVREYAEYGFRVAEEAKMLQYTGMARAQYAWLAWRAGDLAETKRQAHAVIADWDSLGQAMSWLPFRWMALFPLMGVALQEDGVKQAIRWAQHVTTPPQQRLPDDLTSTLERSVTAWEDGQAEAAEDLLRQALQLAQVLHYL